MAWTHPLPKRHQVLAFFAGLPVCLIGMEACGGSHYNVAAIGDESAFDKARQVPAWLGLTPKQDSSGGKAKLLGLTASGYEWKPN